MSIARFSYRSLNDTSLLRQCRPFVNRSFSTNANEDPSHNRSAFDSSDDLFSGGNIGNDDGFNKHLDKAEKDRRDYGSFNRSCGSIFSGGGGGGSVNRDEIIDPFSDGVYGKLKEASSVFNDEEYGVKDVYSLRTGYNNLPRDVKYRKQMQRPRQNNKPGITTEEVLKKADFRNVKFLAQFITEAGIIIQRKQTGISAKAQRKIAKEIKTARAFGLMPFTTMGTKAFTFGKTMENREQDFEYEVLDDDDEYDNPPE
ncbi:unnamed protein product [Cochlearia groenlandica]